MTADTMGNIKYEYFGLIRKALSSFSRVPFLMKCSFEKSLLIHLSKFVIEKLISEEVFLCY